MTFRHQSVLRERYVQLETAQCWCCDPYFATRQIGSGWVPEPCSVTPEADETESNLFLLVFPKLTLKKASRAVDEELSLCLPVAAWYYGCREDHRTKRGDFHSCITVLVALAQPCLVDCMMTEVVAKIARPGLSGVAALPVVSAASIPWDEESRVCFEVVAGWFDRCYAFVSAVVTTPGGGPFRSDFGDVGIVAVLRHWFPQNVEDSRYWQDRVSEARRAREEADDRMWERLRPVYVTPPDEEDGDACDALCGDANGVVTRWSDTETAVVSDV